MIDVLIEKIKKGSQSPHTNHYQSNAMLYKQFYTGKNDFELLTTYRKLETDLQKAQRNRITIRRPKSVCHQIEHTLDKLQTLDKAVINISVEGKETESAKLQSLNTYIYENNISQQAFDFVKYYNMIDANAFLVCGLNEFSEPEFKVIESFNVFDFKIKNDKVDYLIIDDGKTKDNHQKYMIYTQDANYNVVRNGTVVDFEEIKTGMCYAYHLGYILDAETHFKTFKTILSSSEQLLKQLLWDGSEYDIIKALHGIIKQFAYAKDCNFNTSTDDGHVRCVEGQLFLGDTHKGICNSCKGSGLRIHTSSQDIIYLPEPMGTDFLKLDQLTHTVFIPDSILTTRKNDIYELENKIIRTVFNANMNETSETQKTAYEVKTENSGLIAQFQKLGNKVSDTFIWMVECVSSIYGIENVKVFHGFSMDLNLDTLDSLFAQREQAIKAGVSNDVIMSIDTDILKKQHMDNPDYIKRVQLWETFKPFKNFTVNERAVALGSMDVPQRDKVLYLNWDRIKTVVQFENDNFFELTREQQLVLINAEIDKVLAELEVKELVPDMSAF